MLRGETLSNLATASTVKTSNSEEVFIVGVVKERFRDYYHSVACRRLNFNMED